MSKGNMPPDEISSVRVPFGYVAEFEEFLGAGTINRVEGKPYIDNGEYKIAPCQPVDFPTNKLTVRRSKKIGPV